MPAKIRWYCEGVVLYSEFAGVVTKNDLIAYSAHLRGLMDSAHVPLVHIITDVSRITSQPPLREVMKYTKAPDRVGWSIVIGMNMNPIMRFLAQVISSALRLRYRDMTTLDEALEFLQKMDSTLPDLQALRYKAEEGQPVG